MKSTINFYLVCFLLLAQYLIAQPEDKPSALYSKIDKYLEAGTANGFSGAIAVVKDGKMVINKGYGIADRKMQTSINPNTVFDIGSNTKQFTATAILKLREMGKLNLEDPLKVYFKNLPADKQEITIHHLLSHTSGLKDAIGKDFDEISEEEFFQSVFSSSLLVEPGQKYSYSNIGYSVLGRIIELVSEESYEDFLNKYLFTPAGMGQTGYFLPQWDSTEIAASYNRGILEGESPIFKYLKQGKVTWHLNANGGINSTQNDMLLWYEALKSNKILSKESTELMSTPYVNYPNSELAYGYGWTVRTLENKMKRIAHNGSNGAYAHSLIWIPEQDIFISYATNVNSEKVEYLAYTVLKMLLDESYVPEPIMNNVYAFIVAYVRENEIDRSQELISLLKEHYPDKFNSSRLLNSIGNILLMLNEEKDWSVELFKRNVELYPDDGNLWDSLGDGYMAIEQKAEAMESYKKAIELGYEGANDKLKELTKG